jgi:stearoyl-CoA desaturase (delta-9 desaturase)
MFFLGYLATSIGAEIGFHRYFSHGSFKCRPWLKAALGVLGSMAGEGPLFFWVSVHRQHHRYSDQVGDPHSPHPAGIAKAFEAHIGWMFAIHKIPVRPVPDLMRDPMLTFIHRTYLYWVALGLIAPTAIGGWVGGWDGAVEGLVWAGLVRMFVQHQITWSINSITHLTGSRAYETGDQSRNIWITALPTLGGSWHNNHHAFPSSFANDHHWWQFDLGAWIIRAWCWLGMAFDAKSLPPADTIAKRQKRRAKQPLD